MKRRDLERHLHEHGCEILREGGSHTVYTNPANGNGASIPRHNEIKTPTVRKICEQLDIPRPAQR
jgi:predicted RNA binding protein YcfA (HicA-like mRNA interferase family)